MTMAQTRNHKVAEINADIRDCSIRDQLSILMNALFSLSEKTGFSMEEIEKMGIDAFIGKAFLQLSE